MGIYHKNVLSLSFTWKRCLSYVTCVEICYEQVHVESVLAILLSTFVGFGIAMVTSTSIIEYYNYKRRNIVPVRTEQVGEGARTLGQAPESISSIQIVGDQPQPDHVVLQMPVEV